MIVQFGGQTPLNLARGLKEAGVPILGTTVESLDDAGDREQFRELVQRLGMRQPANGIARSLAEAREIARKIGYPGAGAAIVCAGRPGDGNRLG